MLGTGEQAVAERSTHLPEQPKPTQALLIFEPAAALMDDCEGHGEVQRGQGQLLLARWKPRQPLTHAGVALYVGRRQSWSTDGLT